MSFLRHEKIYQSDGRKRELNGLFNSLTDHRSDESSTGYSFMSCSPAELMSASPVLQSFSLNLAAVKPSAANPQLSLFSLSQPRGPLHVTYSLPDFATFQKSQADPSRLHPSRSRSKCSETRMAFAMIVSDGFTALADTKQEASTT